MHEKIVKYAIKNVKYKNIKIIQKYIIKSLLIKQKFYYGKMK